MLPIDPDALCGVARLAGQAILDIYATDFGVDLKADRSPITQADRASNAIIAESLKALYPDIPILSEETDKPDYAARRAWKRFWLVDPLDGTKEFVARNGEFTVNIALVEGVTPAFGVLYAPVTDTLYSGGPGLGARRARGGRTESVGVRRPEPGQPLVVVRSRSHPDPSLDAYLAQYPNHRDLTAGSALKFALVAEGTAHLYPRFNPTWEWDTAAGQAIILGAGGSFAKPDGSPFVYNKEDLKNGGFVAKSWRD